MYRATLPGGPYTLLDASLITGTSYVDNSVGSGQTYYYCTTAVDANNVESAYSKEAVAVVPVP
jgi:fibronectin type 3 domain-containing protein